MKLSDPVIATKLLIPDNPSDSIPVLPGTPGVIVGKISERIFLVDWGKVTFETHTSEMRRKTQ